jgi:ubiquinone/menaquinone biosynthesis C-methylase UbiE
MIKKIYRKIKSKFFRKPFGTQNAQNRNNWLKSVLGDIPRGSTILDAGAGNGNKKKYCKNLNYISQDIAEYKGISKSGGLHTGLVDYSELDIVSDIVDIPLNDESIDAIMCTEVIEHVEDPLLVFKEFSRLLKKDGVLILTAPFNSLTHYSPHHYATGFSKFYYQKNLPKFNFEIINIEPNGNYFEYFAQETRRINEVSETYSNKIIYNPFYYLSRIYMLNLLRKLSEKDNGSSELLCFGYNVIAKKN